MEGVPLGALRALLDIVEPEPARLLWHDWSFLKSLLLPNDLRRLAHCLATWRSCRRLRCSEQAGGVRSGDDFDESDVGDAPLPEVQVEVRLPEPIEGDDLGLCETSEGVRSSSVGSPSLAFVGKNIHARFRVDHER